MRTRSEQLPPGINYTGLPGRSTGHLFADCSANLFVCIALFCARRFVRLRSLMLFFHFQKIKNLVGIGAPKENALLKNTRALPEGLQLYTTSRL